MFKLDFKGKKLKKQPQAKPGETKPESEKKETKKE